MSEENKDLKLDDLLAKAKSTAEEEETLKKLEGVKEGRPSEAVASEEKTTGVETRADQVNPKSKPQITKSAFTVIRITVAAMIAALYVLLTLPMASFTFGIIQFRLAEVLTVLPVFSFAAVPGVFVGCLISNILNPQSLGLIDILGGSLATLIAALLTYWLGGMIRKRIRNPKSAGQGEEGQISKWMKWMWRVIALAPPVIINAFTVGIYLPYLLTENRPPTPLEVVGSVTMIFLSQSFVIYAIGLPVLSALERAKLPLDKL